MCTPDRIAPRRTFRERSKHAAAVLCLGTLAGCMHGPSVASDSPIYLAPAGATHRYVLELWAERYVFFAPGFIRYKLRPIADEPSPTTSPRHAAAIDLGRLGGQIESTLNGMRGGLCHPCWLISVHPPVLAGLRGSFDDRLFPPPIGERFMAPMKNIWLIQRSDLGRTVNFIVMADSLEAARDSETRVIDLPREMSLEDLLFNSDVLAGLLATREPRTD